MDLYYATTNSGKLSSLQRDLRPYGINVIQAPMEIPEPRSSDVQEIAREKVLYAYKKIKKPVVVLDAGFYIHSLNGFPRAFVNFALETINLGGILKLVENKERTCEFRECLAYLDNSLKEPKYFIDHVRGTLSFEPKGVMHKYLWSELGLIFIPEGSKKTLADMNQKEYLQWHKLSREKNSSSRHFSEWFTKYMK